MPTMAYATLVEASTKRTLGLTTLGMNGRPYNKRFGQIGRVTLRRFKALHARPVSNLSETFEPKEKP